MPILHIRITENSEVINLDRNIHSQNFIFKRAVIVQNPATTNVYNGGLTIKLSFLSGGLEFASNINSDEFSVAIQESQAVNDVRFDLNFSAEDISRSFQTDIFNYNKSGARPVFDASNLLYVDLYFEYDELYQYNTY